MVLVSQCTDCATCVAIYLISKGTVNNGAQTFQVFIRFWSFCLPILRYMWQRLSAVRMFIEHVYPSDAGVDPDDVTTILKLWKVRNKGDHSKYVFPFPLKLFHSLNVVVRIISP